MTSTEQSIVFLSIVKMMGPCIHHHKVYLSLCPMLSYAFRTFGWHPLGLLYSQLLPESTPDFRQVLIFTQGLEIQM